MSRLHDELIGSSIAEVSAPQPRIDAAAWPRAWYALATARELRGGRVLAREIDGHPLVLWRDGEGRAVASAAHCPHVGAHLAHGDVHGGRLRCPLHHWSYDHRGDCRNECGERRPAYRLATWPTHELGGVVFVHAGSDPGDFPIDAEGQEVSAGRPVPLRTRWFAVIANAFDMRHLGMVHHRALLQPPVTERTADSFRLHTVTRVLGHGLFHELVRAASGDAVETEITSHGGPLLHVRSRVGGRVTQLLLSARPERDGVSMLPIVLSPRGGPAEWLRHRVARWGYLQFLRRDIEILDDMRFRPRLDGPSDDVLGRFLDFARTRPAAEAPR
ncbi:MAG: Rieske 2Fe-2S domain-containing protein [Candidatus Eisenbacteria bacterium]